MVCDMFAGIGPFAVPAARRCKHVFANDLNPASYSFLVENSRLNGVRVEAFNLDAREFARHVCMYVCMYICLYVCMHGYLYPYVCMYICVYQ